MSGDTPRTGTGSASLPQGLPRRARNTPAPPRLREDPADAPSAAAGDDTEGTLRPDELARVMVAIQRGTARARLAAADGSDSSDGSPSASGTPGTGGPLGIDGRPAPRPGPEAS
ncbi:hypothetical protein PV330_07130 [Streptomyces caniscabiei]|uniref:hypothetical protein n=2 Tax=Streptomyces caniscabiei TaxID=2746961 RepID=UPI0029AE79F8|nr:hypothetical protein [Streptomyces caniscabiei]MDX2599802.1 hypothetical protein [Streptomyces caniscabiei]MDX2734903.1 hypothetical protein [Streptomyces caniscabiei]